MIEDQPRRQLRHQLDHGMYSLPLAVFKNMSFDNTVVDGLVDFNIWMKRRGMLE